MSVLSKYGDSVGTKSVYASAILSSLVIVLILSTLFGVGFPGFSKLSLTNSWNPHAGKFGIVPMLFGSFVVTGLALLMAVPLGVATALYVSEVMKKKYRLMIKSILELLAAIPSVVYGLIGVAFVSVAVENVFGLSHGRTLLTAAMLLAVMILPVLITLCDDAFQMVPRRYRDSVLGLGKSKFRMVREVIVPISFPGLVSAVLLATGRALGETIAVMLVIGSIDKLPSPIYNILSPGQTITSKLGREVAESSLGSAQFSALIAVSLLILLVVLAVSAVAQYLVREERLHE